MSETFRCLICREGSGESVFLGCEDYYLRKPFKADYYRCRGCGLLQQFPIPDDVSAFYEDYPIHARKTPLYELTRRLVMSPVYYKLSRHPKGARLLDYGCGDGGYLAANQGKGFTLLGYENDPEQAGRLATRLDLPVYADMGRLLAEHAESVDVVTMHFVLEHLVDPDEAFAEVRQLLKPGGTFYFVVPQPTSFEARLFGRKWHNLDPPRHISFPEIEAVRRLADRHHFVLTRHEPVAFPNGFAASVPVILAGRFTFPLFLLSLPLGIAFSRLAPTGSGGYWLAKS